MENLTCENPRMKMTFAQKPDAPLVLNFILLLAEYEKCLDQVTATTALLEEYLFTQKKAEAIIAYYDDEPVGFMLFFYNFSTFLGRPGIYLEDLFVDPSYRKKGIGIQMLKTLTKLALDRDCGRLDWSCLKWNKASIDFYHSLGAVELDGWSKFRLTEDKMKALVE